MAFLEGMKRHLSAAVRTNPTVHCGEGEASDSHCLLAKGFWKYVLLLRRRQKIEEFGARHVVDIDVNILLFNQGKGFLDKGEANLAALKYDRPLALPPCFSKEVDARGGVCCGSEPQCPSVDDVLRRTGDKWRDDCWPFGQSCRDECPQLLGVPWGERNDRPMGEILLENLEGLRIGVCWSVLSCFDAGMSAD